MTARPYRFRLQIESTVFRTKSADNRTTSAALQCGVKRYHQYCPVAHALDLIGDRWALLIVRELMLGQRRYTDLADALPGIGTNILAGRFATSRARASSAARSSRRRRQ